MKQEAARRHAAELIVIADERARSALPEIVADIRVKVVDWRDAGALSSVGDAAILVDVDLRNIAIVKRIKDNLPVRNDNQCRIIAVDRGSRHCEAQANGLGASDVLQRPVDIHQLKVRLASYVSQRQTERDVRSEDVRSEDVCSEDRPDGPAQSSLKREPGGASIVSAAAELDRMFAALTCRRPLNLASIAQSGNQVMDAIADVGLAPWLDMVRKYHESTFQHCLIVTGILTAFGHKNGMRKSDILTLTIAGLLHDIGKAQVPIDVLDKPGQLTKEEFEQIKRQPVVGYDYLCTQNIVGPETLQAVRHHHEYLDGSGYPDGLTAPQINDLTRILTICDVYGALLEQRAYRVPKSPAMALNILTGMARDGKVEYELVRALQHSV